VRDATFSGRSGCNVLRLAYLRTTQIGRSHSPQPSEQRINQNLGPWTSDLGPSTRGETRAYFRCVWSRALRCLRARDESPETDRHEVILRYTEPAHNPDRAGSVCFKPGRINARDRLRIGWEGYRESRRCSREIYSESNITKYTGIRRENHARILPQHVARKQLLPQVDGRSKFCLTHHIHQFVLESELPHKTVDLIS